jgi:DNA-binding transcriptional MerR regulator
MRTVHIGEIAKRFDLNPRTIRYYETIGVLPKAARTESGYRIYSKEAASRLEFVLKAKSLGLTLDEIRKILSLHDKGVVPCEHTKDFVRHKVKEINAKINALVSLKKTLSRVLKTRFRKHSASSFCPLIEAAGRKTLTLHPTGRLTMG